MQGAKVHNDAPLLFPSSQYASGGDALKKGVY